MTAANPNVCPPLLLVYREKFWKPALRESPTTTRLFRAAGPFSFAPNAMMGRVPKVARQITDEARYGLLSINGSSDWHDTSQISLPGFRFKFDGKTTEKQ